MGKTFLKETAKLMQENVKKKRWHRIVISLSLVVAMTTSYLLIEPAITMERTPECGVEEHTHTAECYERQLVCGQEEQEAVPATEERILNCPLEEHEHAAECYDEEGNLICGHEAHVHDNSCYQIVTTPGVEGHTHTDACYQDVLVCQKPEHTHTDACYPAEEEPEPAAEEEQKEDVSEEKPEESTEEPATEEVTYEAGVLRADGADYNVQVEYSADAQIPKDATLSVRELKKETTPQEYDSYYNSALAKVKQLTAKTITYARIFDVKMYNAEGYEIQPLVPVTVKFTYYNVTQNPAGNEVKAVYFGSETQLLNVETNEYNQAWNEAVVRNVNGVSVFVVGGIAVEQPAEEPVTEPASDETVTEEPAADDTVTEEPAEAQPEEDVIIEGEDQTEETGKADDAEVVDLVEEQPQDADASQENPDAEAKDGETNNIDAENPETTDGEPQDTENAENPDGDVTDPENPDADTVDPENPDAENPEDGTNEDPDAEPTEAPAEDASEETETTEETEFTDGVLAFEGSDYTVQVSYTADSKIPENAELQVREIQQGTEEYDNYYQQAVAAMENGEVTSISFARFFDITILADGEEFEPAAPVEVKVSYANAVEVPQDGDVKSVHFGDNAEVLDVQTNAADGALDEVTFAADSFSVYGIVGREVLTGDVITADGESYTVTVSYGAEARIPSGSTLKVEEINPQSATYQNEFNNAESLLNAQDENLHVFRARFFDIRIMNGEEEVQPQADVQVEISAKDVVDDGEGVFVTHTHGNQTTLVDATAEAVAADETKFSFALDSFSNVGTVSANGSVTMLKNDTATLSGSNWQRSSWTSDSNCIEITSSTNQTAEITAKSVGTAKVTHSRGNSSEVFNITVAASINCTLTFDGNGSTSGNVPASITGNRDTEITFPDPADTNLAKNGEVFVGWSTMSTANTGDGATYHRAAVYQAGASYELKQNETFYAIWATTNTMSSFYLRLDGRIPFEPCAAGEESNYNANSYTSGVTIKNALKVAKFYPNTGNGVDDNLNDQPTIAQLIAMINNSSSALGFTVDSTRNDAIVVNSITNATTNNDGYNVEVGDQLYVKWYVCKKAVSGPLLSGYTVNNWHVDGVLLKRSLVNLIYDAGDAPAGTYSNMPIGSQHKVNTPLKAGIDSDLKTVKIPVRSDGYLFKEWKMYTKDADGKYTVSRGVYESGKDFVIAEDTLLVAQWVKDKSDLTIRKVDFADSNTTLEGARFELEANGNKVENTTSAKGEATFKDIEIDTIYTLTEMDPPDKYKILLNGPIYFKEVKNGSTYEVKLYKDSTGTTELTEAEKNDLKNKYGVVVSTVGRTVQIQVANSRIVGKAEFTKTGEITAGGSVQPLTGAKFQLYSDEGCTKAVGDAVESGADGKVSFTEIPTGTYYMKEVEAPDGYVLDESVYEVQIEEDTWVIEKGDQVISSSDPAASILNKLACVNIRKTDMDGNGLSGAVFQLTRVTADGVSEKLTSLTVNGVVSSGENADKITVPVDGSSIEGLLDGTYRLTEITAPAGYIILNKTIDFEIKNGKIVSSNIDGENVTFESATNTFVIKNAAGRELPNTGGIGNTPFVIGGTLLMLIAFMTGLVLAIRRRRAS